MKALHVLMGLALIGCGSTPRYDEKSPFASETRDFGIDLPSAQSYNRFSLQLGRSREESKKTMQMVGDETRPDRKVIFNGALSVQVADMAAAERQIGKIVEEAKGWIHRIDGNVYTLRVPAPQFHAIVEKVAALGRLLDRKIAGTDVSEEYRDLELRLKNAEEVRKRLAALLEKTKDVKETLEVEKELARVSEEIERLKGKLQAMAAAVEYSTIVVNLQHTGPLQQGTRGVRFPFDWIHKLGVDPLMEFHR